MIMQYSIVTLAELKNQSRIDAEYFKPENLKIEKKLKSLHAVQLSECCKEITASAFYPAATQLYSIGKIPFIRCVDCVNFPLISDLQNSSFERIPEEFFSENKNIKKLEKEEIIVTKVGTPCYASILTDLEYVALSRTVLGLRGITNIDPYYLTAFLRSYYGYEQLLRERELTIQYQLTLERIGNIWVYIPYNKIIEKQIRMLFLKSIELQKKEKNEYKNIDNLLKKIININNLSVSNKKIYLKNFSDTQNANRIDAEYFQPKYDEIINKIKSYSSGWDILDDIVLIKKGIEIGADAYTEEGIPFIRVSNLNKFGITDNSQQYLSEKLYEDLKSKYQPKKDDILLSKDGTPGIAYLLSENPQKMIISGGILRLVIKNKEYLPEYLTLVLNSIFVQEQIEQKSSGALIKHWLIDEIKNTVIPKLEKVKQQEIVDKIKEATLAKKQSKQLLEIAKRGVEKAIEENEDIAMQWMNEQLEAIGVSL